MFLSKYLMPFAAITVVSTIPSIAAANSFNVVATTIPASDCRPENNITDSRVALSNGAYIFTGDFTGTVTFFCPLPINGNTVTGVGNNSISSYRVYYRDPDATGNGFAVTTQLLYRNSDGLAPPVGATWSSSSVVGGSTSNTTRSISLIHNLGSSRLYYFLVRMTRTSVNPNPNLNPAFSGIDFPVPIPG